jgi:hypothetical protein
MIEFCFTNLEYYLKQIKNSDDVAVFALPRRLVREKPDIDFIKANVKEKNPYCLITIADYNETKFGILFDNYPDYFISDIAHVGKSSAAYQINGNHQGNNSYILKIAAGGTIGTEPYPTYQLKVNDDNWTDPAEIPASGIIPIEDNLTFNFQVAGIVITDDTYSFQTTAQQIKVYKEKEIIIKYRVEIWAKTKLELFQTGGYFDQLSQLMIDRYVTDGIQIINLSPSGARWIQSEFETEHSLIRGAQEFTYQGAIYTKKIDALITKFLFT